jgi:hypothetical protein
VRKRPWRHTEDGRRQVEQAVVSVFRKFQQLGEKRKALELTLERARYEEKRARRQFDAVEPETV